MNKILGAILKGLPPGDSSTTLPMIVSTIWINILFFFFFCLLVVAISWAAPTAHGGPQARGRTGAAATGPRQSHSNAGSEPRLQPTPQLMVMPDP